MSYRSLFLPAIILLLPLPSPASNAWVGMGTTSPNSTLQVVGSLATNVNTQTSSYTLTSTDTVVFADATSSAITMTLPSAAAISGRIYTLKKIDSSSHAVTVATTSSQTIDGSATYSLSSQYSNVTVISDGSNWNVISTIAATSSCNSGQSDVQTFTSNGTWTKPGALPSNCYVLAQVWGGGGGGGRSNQHAGSGGGYTGETFTASSLLASVAITVGAGGTGYQYATSTAATSGNLSKFGSYLTAYGGIADNGSPSSYPLGGGCNAGAGAAYANGSCAAVIPNISAFPVMIEPGGMGSATGSCYSAQNMNTGYSGGGGGAYNCPPGTSLYGGSGGAGAGSGDGGAGSVPGGGGGTPGPTGNGGNGGSGKVKITSYW